MHSKASWNPKGSCPFARGVCQRSLVTECCQKSLCPDCFRNWTAQRLLSNLPPNCPFCRAEFRKSRSYWREGGHVQVKSASIVHRCLPGGLGVSTDIGQFSHLFPQLKKSVVETSVRKLPITVSFTFISAHNCEFHTYFHSYGAVLTFISTLIGPAKRALPPE